MMEGEKNDEDWDKRKKSKGQGGETVIKRKDKDK